MNQVLEPDIESNIKTLSSTVKLLNSIKLNNQNSVNEFAKEIKEKISEGVKGDLYTHNGIKYKITEEQSAYNVELLDTNSCSDETLKALQGLKLTVQKQGNGEYKFGVKFKEGTVEEFSIGGLNEKLPYLSQVSALEGLSKHLTLVATATGSGKTITKLMFSLVASLSGMKVVSIDPRGDLVSQEYEDQEGAVHYKSTTHISHDNLYKESKAHNILSLDKFFSASNKIISLDKLSKLIKDHNAENEGFKVDLKQKKITVGRNIEIYQDHYKVNGKKVKESIFNNNNLLLIFDEIQDMVNQGEAYCVETELLLLLASWKKINLVITTATPPVWIKEFIEKEEGHIEAQSLKQKINAGIGGRIDIAVSKNSKDEQFVRDYVKYSNDTILERSEDEKYYSNTSTENDIKKAIRQTIMWNLQSPRNRMTLVCSDSNESTQLLQNAILSPEKQLKTLKNLEEVEKDKLSKETYNECNFYNSMQRGDNQSIKSILIDDYGVDKEIDEVLKEEFDFTSSIAENGVFSVAHGFIDNFISCVTEVQLDELSQKRFADFDSLKSKFKKSLTNFNDSKISEYITSTLKIEGNEQFADIKKGMKIVYNLFETYKGNDEKLNLLLMNHNLSREIHKMIPPDLSILSQDNILEIFAQSRNDSVFKYLRDTYEIDTTIETECEKLYKEWEKAHKEAEDCKEQYVDPAYEKWVDAYYALQNAEKELKNALCDKKKGNLVVELRKRVGELKLTDDQLRAEYVKQEGVYGGLVKEVDKKKKELADKFKTSFRDEATYPLYKLRSICNKFAICTSNTKDECLEDKLSQAGLVGYYFNNHRKSGFNNTKLYNVVMRETVKDDLENKKQCVGRPGRKSGPIISSSYVDSSKISNPDHVQNQLENGSPFESGNPVKNKINPQEYAERMTKRIEDIIDEKYQESESEIAKEIMNYCSAIYNELCNNSGYKRDETQKAFIQTLKNTISTLTADCKEKNIVIGDSTIKFNIRGIESKIDDLVTELNILSNELDLKVKRRDKINEKLKIEGSFLKRLIIKLCTLVLHLWHWRLSPTQEQISEILEKDDSSSIKEKVILRKAASQVKNGIKPLEKKLGKLKSEESNFTHKKMQLQDQYNELNKYVGVIKRKDGVMQKEITDSERDSIIKNQQNGIEKELYKATKSLNKSEEKHDKDLKKFKDLKDKIDSMKLIEVKDTLEKLIEGNKDDNLQEKDLQELIEKIRKNIKSHENQTKIERLYNFVDKGLQELMEGVNKSNTILWPSASKFMCGEARKGYVDKKILLSYIDLLIEEKSRLEKIQEEQEGLEKRIDKLREEKEKLNDCDTTDKQINICSKLLVYKSIHKNYDLKRCIWFQKVFHEFYSKKDEDHDDYISSSVFLELFTNIFMPLMNDGTLKLAFYIINPSGNYSEEQVNKINEFYQNLVSRNFDKINEDDVKNIWKCMFDIGLPIACTKINHYHNAFSKDCDLINNITFGKFNLLDIIKTHAPYNLKSNIINRALADMKEHNPLTSEIYTNDINSGTTLFSTLNLLTNIMFQGISVERAKKSIEKLGKKKDEDDVKKDVCENLTIALNKSIGCGSDITWNNEKLTEEELSAKKFQEFGNQTRLASKQKELPAQCFIDPKVDRVNGINFVK